VADFIPHEHTILGFSVPYVEVAVRDLREKGVIFIIHPALKQDELGIVNVPGEMCGWLGRRILMGMF
jgi:hypothetical protein